MELFAVLLVMYVVKIAAEDTYHGIKGTPNPRHAARARRQRTRSKSRTWGALSNYWGDLVEDATEAATEHRRRKAAERRQKREEKPDEEVLDAEYWEDGDREPHQDPWEKARPVYDPNDTLNCRLCNGSVVVDGEICPRCRARQEERNAEWDNPAATSPAADPSNVFQFPNRLKENDMASTATEIQGLDQAIEYARHLSDEAAQHGSAGNEGYIARLAERNVSGITLQSAAAMQEAFANAAAAAEAHAVDLEEGKVVQEAYDQAPDSGDQEFAQGGR